LNHELEAAELVDKFTNHEHGDGLAKDGVEKIQCSSSRHHEEVTDEEIFTTTVVKHRILQAAEQALKRILHSSSSPSPASIIKL